jgi:hypothetical protein
MKGGLIMKYYIIEDTNGDWNNIFVVKANNKKEALSKLWENMDYDNQEVVDGYVPHYKKDFTIDELDEIFENDMAILN